jgi:ferrous iron transport protein B
VILMADGGQPQRKIVLVGNPNVGKSVIFRLLTGSYVLVSNFPGTTVEISRGRLNLGGISYEVVDTPGVYSLIPQSEDERVTTEILLKEKPDIIIQVADAKNLRRTLLITSQLAELRTPLVIAMNMMDEAEERGVQIDMKGLSDLFSVPVVETIAIYSRGKKKLLQAIQDARPPAQPIQCRSEVEQVIRNSAEDPVPAALLTEWIALGDKTLTDALQARFGLQAVERLKVAIAVRRGKRRSLAKEIAEDRGAFLDSAVARLKKKRDFRMEEEPGEKKAKPWLFALAAGLALFIWNEAGGWLGLASPYTWMLHWLHRGLDGIAGSSPPPGSTNLLRSLLIGNITGGRFEYGILPEIIHFGLVIAPVIVPLAILLTRSRSFTHEIGVWTRRPSTGLPILAIVLLLMFEFVGYTGAQTLVGLLEKVLFGQYLIPLLRGVIPAGFIHDFIAGRYGLVSMGLTYAVAIVLPVVTTFFIAFSLLEDSGYLPRLSILSDRVMRIMGLNGKATLPMVLGLGCVTMATMTTRILNSRKERLIATLLLALGVPCSAQLGVILGIAAGFSIKATLTVIGVVLLQLLLVGFLASKIMRGRTTEFIFEIPPIRVPQMKNVLLKTAHRIWWYLKEAVPLFLYGTLFLFGLDRVSVAGRNLLEWLQVAFEPLLVGVLHLPAEAASVFVLGFLRRDYGAAGLFTMARDGLLSPQQVVVSLITITLFVPCVASFLVIAKEQGIRKAIAITAFIVPFAISVGGVVGWVLRTLSITFT